MARVQMTEVFDGINGVIREENPMPENMSFEIAFDAREPELCSICGNPIDPDEVLEVETSRGTHHVHSEEELTEYGYERCEQCGIWVHEYDQTMMSNGDVFCSWHCARDAGWMYCSHCDEWVDENDTYYIDDRDEYWCEYCAENYAWYCGECDRWVSSYSWDDEGDMCEECAQDSMANALHDYSFSDRVDFVKRGDDLGGKRPHIGVELETEKGDTLNQYVQELHQLFGGDVDRYYMSRDASLRGNSAEIVSHPFTLEYHMNEGVWGEMMEIAKKYGYTSSCPRGGGCGTHYSIDSAFFGKSKLAQDLGGYKMLRIMQRFSPMWRILSRREDFGYCCFKTNYPYDKKEWKEQVGKNHPDMGNYEHFAKARFARRNERDHSLVVNLTHSERFEIRLFAGTLNIDTLYAEMGFCEGLAIVAKNHSVEWVENVRFYDLIGEIVDAITVPKSADLLVRELEAMEII